MEIDPMETYAPAPPEATETQEQDPAGDDIIGSQAKRAVPEASMAPGTASVKRARTPREGVRRGKWTAEVRSFAPTLRVPLARVARGGVMEICIVCAHRDGTQSHRARRPD